MNYTKLYKESIDPTICISSSREMKNESHSVVDRYSRRYRPVGTQAQAYRTEIQSEEERTNIHMLSNVISQMNKELEYKRVELERCKKGLVESDRLLSNAVEQLQQIQAKVESVVEENKRLKYAGNEFRRMGVIEERDRLLKDVARLQYELKCSRELTSNGGGTDRPNAERCWY